MTHHNHYLLNNYYKNKVIHQLFLDIRDCNRSSPSEHLVSIDNQVISTMDLQLFLGNFFSIPPCKNNPSLLE